MTDIKEERDVLAEAERMRIMLDANPLATHLWDRTYNIIDFNQAALTLFEVPTREEYLERFYYLCPELQPDGTPSIERIQRIIQYGFEEGEQCFEFMHQTLGGEPVPTEVCVKRVQYNGKEIVASYTRDLRDQKRMIKEVDDSAKRLKAVVSNYPGAICSADKDMNVTLFDGLLVPYLVSKDLFYEGADLSVALQHDSLKHVMGRLKNTLTEGAQDWTFEAFGKALHMTTTPLTNEKGEVSGLVAKLDDVTEMTNMQKDLKEALEKAEAAVQETAAAQLTTSAMFEANPQINILFNNRLQVIDCNPGAIKFMRFETKESLLENFVEFMQTNLLPVMSDGRPALPLPERLMIAAKQGHDIFDTEIYIGGEKKYINVEFQRIPYEESFAIVAYVHDQTEARERELDLQRMRELAETANKAKTSFLSTMSHEIRTPMNAILGITEIYLQNEDLDANIKEAFEKIYTSGDLLLSIINDILDLSKIEAGKMELSPSKYVITSLISDTAQLNMMRIGSKPIEFELEVDENLPTTLLGDELRVKQILNNLLSNAFKYTKSGTVKMSVSYENVKEKDDDVNLVFHISDTGQGMSDDQIAMLFDEYARFNEGANRSTEGTGLGMSITKNLIKLMNGDISVTSEPGKGSDFKILLPQGKIGDEVIGKEVAENLHQFRTTSRAQMKRVQISREPMPYGNVLIVDDVETNIYVARGLMSPYKLKIDSVDSGYAAIDKIKNGKSYDIIFMDHMMPEMDGIEATKIIRELSYKEPIVALTANAVSGQADIFLGNGFDDFISKPIDVRQLNSVLNKLVRDKQPPEVREAARKQADLKKNETVDEKIQTALDPHIAEIFVRDSLKALTVLDEIAGKNDFSDEDDMRTYVINMHGIKSALANIGKMDLSAIALKLESAGRDAKLDIVESETGPFLAALRTYTEDLVEQNTAGSDEEGEDDNELLSKELVKIKEACEEYDENTADEVLANLRKTNWSKNTSELLSKISEHLLHSDFDEIVKEINTFSES